MYKTLDEYDCDHFNDIVSVERDGDDVVIRISTKPNADGFEAPYAILKSLAVGAGANLGSADSQIDPSDDDMSAIHTNVAFNQSLMASIIESSYDDDRMITTMMMGYIAKAARSIVRAGSKSAR